MVNVSLPGIFQEWILEQRFQCRYLILDVIFASTARKLGERDTEWKWAYEDTISNKSPLWVLLLSHFSCVWLCATPWTAAHQAPPSLGFSRQEYWSGLPFPSPMHLWRIHVDIWQNQYNIVKLKNKIKKKKEKWKWSRSVVSNPQRPHELQPSRLLHPWDFLGKSTGVGCHCLLCHFG